MNEPKNTATFDAWCRVELFGHQTIVGHCTEANIAGSVFLRVDIPTDDGEGVKFTRFFHGNAIYGIHPISKEIAVEMARNTDKAPVQPYDVPQLQQKIKESFVARPALPADSHGDDDDQDDEGREY